MFKIANNWYELLLPIFNSSEFKNLQAFLSKEYHTKVVYPQPEKVFEAINIVPYDKVKVVIIGQDPYHQPNQAHGLSFSIQDKALPLPPSLRNIYKELVDDVGVDMPTSGNLTPWAQQGVLLLNAVLTVEKSKPNSHKSKGWEYVTSNIVKKLNERKEPIIFLLWGANAKYFKNFITNSQHYVLEAGHPSPMSANRGLWFGNKCFSKTNDILIDNNIKPINWQL